MMESKDEKPSNPILDVAKRLVEQVKGCDEVSLEHDGYSVTVKKKPQGAEKIGFRE